MGIDEATLGSMECARCLCCLHFLLLFFAQNALLWIGGGHNSDKPPTIWDKDLMVCAALAQELGTVLTAIYAIPNAPIKFYVRVKTIHFQDEEEREQLLFFFPPV